MSSGPIQSRRQFLAMTATVGAAGLLASCAGSSRKSAGAGKLAGANGEVQVVKRFPDSGLVAGKVRLPISLGDTSGVLTADGAVKLPDSLTARIVDSDSGKVVFEAVTAARHGENLSVPYWPFVFDIAAAGIYTMTIDGASGAEASFQIEERDAVLTPLVGDPLPPFDTPTVDNARGVSPICTRPDGTCPFHTQTLTAALTSGKPVLYLIGTPAYCQTGTCAPGLEALISVSETLGDRVEIVHADVYKDRTATVAAPAVQAYKLTYEPVLYITDAKGILVDRLDAVFDVKEMRDTIAAAGIS